VKYWGNEENGDDEIIPEKIKVCSREQAYD